MAKSKFSEHIVKLRCAECKRINYYTRRNRKSTEEKLDIKKHCKWCRAHTPHKEAKK